MNDSQSIAALLAKANKLQEKNELILKKIGKRDASTKLLASIAHSALFLFDLLSWPLSLTNWTESREQSHAWVNYYIY
jgi:hypothetical protein